MCYYSQGTYVHATTKYFVITHEIHVIYALLVHLKVFQFTRSVRQFDSLKIGYKTKNILCSPDCDQTQNLKL